MDSGSAEDCRSYIYPPGTITKIKIQGLWHLVVILWNVSLTFVNPQKIPYGVERFCLFLVSVLLPRMLSTEKWFVAILYLNHHNYSRPFLMDLSGRMVWADKFILNVQGAEYLKDIRHFTG